MNQRFPLLLLVAGGVVSCAGISAAEIDGGRLPKSADREIAFEKDIKPILEKSCVHCHGASKPKGHFRVDSRATILKGGESDEAAIIPGKSASSPLVRFVAGAVREMEMPPIDQREKFPALTENEIGLIRAWIDQGAKWPDGVTLTTSLVAAAGKDSLLQDSSEKKSHPIFEMIRDGDRRGIAKALRDSSVLQERDERGNTPLMQAAFYLDAKQVASFLDGGSDPNATNKTGVTALMKAVWDVEKTRILLKHHATVNTASKDGNTALIIASFAHGAGAVVKDLIAAGADVAAANHTGANAVMAAAEAGDAEALRILLDHHGDPNSKSRIPESNSAVSALMISAQMGHLDCVNLLLDRGADFNMTLEHGNALHFATFTHRHDIVRLLLDRGVNVNARGRRLLSFRNDTGLTPLMYAALNERNDPTVIQWLIERGADVNAKASSGETALSLAQLRGNTRLVSALLAAGAKSEPENNGMPALAPMWTSKQIVQPTRRLVRKATESGMSVLLKSGAKLTEATGNRCFTCHQQSQPALAWSLARDRGLDCQEQIVRDQLNGTILLAKRRVDGAIETPLPVPNIAAWLLVGLNAAKYPADGMTDQYAYALARYQYGDGRWITKASRAPTDYSDVTSTALAIKALKSYAPPTMKKRMDQNVAKAAQWLRGYQSDSAEERAMQILGLYWAGRNQPQLKPLIKKLLAEQRADGGWAQLPSLPSDAYTTGLTLYALNQADGIPASDDRYRNGIKFLLKSQLDDGSWHVQTRASPVQVAINDVFPHGQDQWISSIATGWAITALTLASEIDAQEHPSAPRSTAQAKAP